MTRAAIDTTSFNAMRRAMVASQLRTNAVSDARVIAVMARIPREDFLPEQLRRLAYRDTAITLTPTRSMNAPMTTGRLLTEAAIGEGDRVLLIGAGCGYAAALVAVLAGSVVAVEEDSELAGAARKALACYARATLVEGPLSAGAPDQAPYDVLVIDGALPALPDGLAAQLRPGGRIVGGLVDRGVTRLASGTRSAGGAALVAFADAECVVLPGFAAAPVFSF